MTRPFTVYFLSGWLALWLLGLPVHNQALLVYQIGPLLTFLFLVLVFLATLILIYQLLQCHPSAIEVALGIISLQFGYLLTRFVWLLAHDHVIVSPFPTLAILSINLYLLMYLMLPRFQTRLIQVHQRVSGKLHSTTGQN